jgi:hypothetical protein
MHVEKHKKHRLNEQIKTTEIKMYIWLKDCYVLFCH